MKITSLTGFLALVAPMLVSASPVMEPDVKIVLFDARPPMGTNETFFIKPDGTWKDVSE